MVMWAVSEFTAERILLSLKGKGLSVANKYRGKKTKAGFPF